VARLADETSRAAPQPADSGLFDIVKRELSDIRFSQTETTATPRIRWKPCTTRSAMWSTGWR